MTDTLTAAAVKPRTPAEQAAIFKAELLAKGAPETIATQMSSDLERAAAEEGRDLLEEARAALVLAVLATALGITADDLAVGSSTIN